jgi:hypothetical protein
VINVVNFEQQTSLASTNYADGVNDLEIWINGVPSDLVKPFRVKESPVQFEIIKLSCWGTGRRCGKFNTL